MIITIQGIPERLRSIKQLRNQLRGFNLAHSLYLDKDRISCYQAFKSMLNKYPVDSYRLHLQDDVVLSKHFSKVLKEVEDYMVKNDLHLVSMFAPRRGKFEEYFKDGVRYAPFPNFLWLQAVVFSPYLLKLLKTEANLIEDEVDDDVFVAAVLRKYKIKALVHLPSVVQHRMDVKSSLGHSTSINRQSSLYNENFYGNE